MNSISEWYQKLLASCLWQNGNQQASLSELTVELCALIKFHNHERVSEKQVEALLRSSDLFAEVEPSVWRVKL